VDYSIWLRSYENVLLWFCDKFYKNEDVTSVYFGGGTPSLLPSYFIDRMLNFISSNFRLISGAEITLEANPKTIWVAKAKELLSAGINRLSIGVQSIIDNDLEILGRSHDSKSAISCTLDMASIFDNISIDMIYNRPGQRLEDWVDELNSALSLPIKHISLYELIIEKGTRIERAVTSGEMPQQSDGLAFFDKTFEITESRGFKRYEVSNFAISGYEGRHNIGYWRYEDYYGVGPSSHSRVSVGGQKLAIAQTCQISEWLPWTSGSIFDGAGPVLDIEHLGEDDVFKEKLIVGLRSNIGLDLRSISREMRQRYKLDHKVEVLLRNLCIIKDDSAITLTHKGIMKLNMIVDYMTRG
jgi:oxygen-independent coproporphyrinogen-3 oxidase